MHSHMYFYASGARPDWSKESPDDAISRARARKIADLLVAAIPSLRESHSEVHGPRDIIGLYLSPRDYLTVHHDCVHWDIKYRSHFEQAQDGTMPTLRTVAAILEREMGFDFFESGCQRLDQRGCIEDSRSC